MKRTQWLLWVCVFLTGSLVCAQEDYLDGKAGVHNTVYSGGAPYPVASYPVSAVGLRPHNIVLLIGDGMGVGHVFAGLTANGGALFLDNFKQVGLVKTASSDKFVTDSAAGATALSAGIKTRNGFIGVDPQKQPVKTILEEAIEQGLSGGLVSTSAITHATPAAFIAHQFSRHSYEDIAADFLKTDITVFIGGGLQHFTKRKDGRDLTQELQDKGYQVVRDMDKIAEVSSGKLAGLTAAEHNGRASERGDMLPVATRTALTLLQKDPEGFFLMVEGSQIDWAGHANDTTFLVQEMLDFDRTIGEVLSFAAADGQTLVIVTADHETGGVAITGGDSQAGRVEAGFVRKDHTAVMVPLFAWGPGAENFTGIMDNTDVHQKMRQLLLEH